jgi:uncharacterized membrane protein YedE/YeeE
MSTESVLRALAGGVFCGLAAALALLAHGRIAGVSNIVGQVLDRDEGQSFRIFFLAGLIATSIILAQLAPGMIVFPDRSKAFLAAAGLVVGAGTTFSSGCTSGHAMCGLGRGSVRSFFAASTFMMTGMIAATISGALS